MSCKTLTVREAEMDEARGYWEHSTHAPPRFLICDADDPGDVLWPGGFFHLLPAGADDFDAAVEHARRYARSRGHRLKLPSGTGRKRGEQ